MEQGIIALKSAENKPNNSYSLDKVISAYNDPIDAFRFSLGCTCFKSSQLDGKVGLVGWRVTVSLGFPFDSVLVLKLN